MDIPDTFTDSCFSKVQQRTGAFVLSLASPTQRDLDVLEGILKMGISQPSPRIDDFTT